MKVWAIGVGAFCILGGAADTLADTKNPPLDCRISPKLPGERIREITEACIPIGSHASVAEQFFELNKIQYSKNAKVFISAIIRGRVPYFTYSVVFNVDLDAHRYVSRVTVTKSPSGAYL